MEFRRLTYLPGWNCTVEGAPTGPRSALFRNSHPEAGDSSKCHQSSEKLLPVSLTVILQRQILGIWARRRVLFPTYSSSIPFHPIAHSIFYPIPFHPLPHPICCLLQHRSFHNYYINPVPIFKMHTGNRFSFCPQCTPLYNTQSKWSPRTGLRQTEGNYELVQTEGQLLALSSVTELWTKCNNPKLPRNSILFHVSKLCVCLPGPFPLERLCIYSAFVPSSWLVTPFPRQTIETKISLSWDEP